jgi:hypothetical protein
LPSDGRKHLVLFDVARLMLHVCCCCCFEESIGKTVADPLDQARTNHLAIKKEIKQPTNQATNQSTRHERIVDHGHFWLPFKSSADGDCTEAQTACKVGRTIDRIHDPHPTTAVAAAATTAAAVTAAAAAAAVAAAAVATAAVAVVTAAAVVASADVNFTNSITAAAAAGAHAAAAAIQTNSYSTTSTSQQSGL